MGWGGGGATFLQGALGQKFQPPRNPERENIELLRGGVRANVWRWERERERERETQNRNSAALIGMWVDAGGGRLHM